MRIIIMGVFVALISLPAYAFPSVVSGSYYHDRFEGRRMACGGRFDSDKLTAASNHHPCGSKVLVKYGAREVVVDVTDRCGHCGIDLSRSAARELGLIQVGRAPVSVERVSAQPDRDPSDAAASDVPPQLSAAGSNMARTTRIAHVGAVPTNPVPSVWVLPN